MNRRLVISLALLLSGPAYSQAIPLDEAGFTEYVANLLRKEVSDVPVTVEGPLALGLGVLQANLDRVHDLCKREQSACPAELNRFAKAAAQMHKDAIAPPRKEAVSLAVRSAEYIQAAQANAGAHALHIQTRPFAEGLVSLPVLDSPRTIRMLTSEDNDRLGLSEAAVFDLGLANLRSTLKPLMEVAKVVPRGQVGKITGNPFDSSRVLLHDSWAPLAKAQGGVLIVAIPATDAVFYIGENTPEAIDVLRTAVKDTLARAPNRLSNVLLRWTEAGWVAVQ